MKLEEIYIDGFGKYHDFRLADLAPGLTVFIGPNEAGKSTIMALIRRILFGFPDGRSKLNQYPPLVGGNRGGRLVVSTSDGAKYVIERYSASSNAAKVTLPDGSTGGQQELVRLLGAVNKGVFENVFAFGLGELQDFETLNSDEIKGRLYSAGAGVGAVSVSKALKTIDAQAGELFKRGGSKPPINQLVREMSDISSRIREIEADAQNFDALTAKSKELEQEIADAKTARDQLRAELSHKENLINAWPEWLKIQDAGERLQEFPEITSFPENGIAYLEEKQARVDALHNDIDEKNDELKTIRIELGLIKLDKHVLNSEAEIRALQNGREQYASAVADLPSIVAEARREQEGLRQALCEIGPDWNEDKLASFDTSIPTKEAVRAKHADIEALKEQVREVDGKATAAKENSNKIKKSLAALSGKLAELPKQHLDALALKEQMNAIRALRAKRSVFAEKKVQFQNLRERGDLLVALRPQDDQPEAHKPLWPAMVMLVAGIMTFTLLATGGNAGAALGVFGLLAVASVAYLISARRVPKIVTEAPNRSEILNNQAQGLVERTRELTAEIRKLEGELLELANVCGLKEIPDAQSIESKDEELQAAGVELQERTDLESKIAGLERDLEESVEQAKALGQDLKKLQSKQAKALAAWGKWLLRQGLAQELTPEGVIDIHSTIKTCFEKQRMIAGQNERIERIQAAIGDFETKSSGVLISCERKSVGVDFVAELQRLVLDLEQGLKDSQALAQLRAQAKGLMRDIGNLEKKHAEQNEAMGALLASGGAKDAIEFRNNAGNWTERTRLLEEVRASEKSIRMVSGGGARYTTFINELKDIDLEGLRQAELTLSETLTVGEEAYEGLINLHGSLTKEIEQIERREEGSALRTNKEVVRHKIMVLANEWAALTLAKTVMRKALEKYEKEKQPSVIKEAQTFFSRITLGRYERIYAPLEQDRIYVADKTGRGKEIQELSRGSAEQLYLSLRFGFIREFSKRAEPLPVVLDDIFVNFDRSRLAAAFMAVKELTESHQVFYFTCHPQIDLLREIAPDLKLVDLSEEESIDGLVTA